MGYGADGSAARAWGELMTHGAAELRVSADAASSRLSAMLALMNRAGQQKPALARLADRVAAWFVGAVLLLAAGVAAWWWQQRLGDQLFGFGDSDSYWHLAGDLARGEPYAYGSQFRVFRSPGYPLLLAPLYWLADPPSIWSARILNAVLGVIAVALSVLVARQLFAAHAQRESLASMAGGD